MSPADPPVTSGAGIHLHHLFVFPFLIVYDGMSERLKEPVLKTGNVKAFVGSNPTAVANAGPSGKFT